MEHKICLGLLLLQFLAFCTSNSIGMNNMVWFPNPKAEGGLIPAYLSGGEDKNQIMDPTKVRFYLYTKGNTNAPDELFIDDIDSVANSHFINNAPIKILAHGFGGSSRDGFPTRIRNEFHKLSQDMNIICVDWSPLSTSPWYDVAAKNTQITGLQSAKLLHFLVQNGFSRLEDIHFIGFSLGGHVCGNAGMEFEKLSGTKLLRVTSLDPAYPLFGDNGAWGSDEFRIDPTDAEFVDVIHTSSGHLLEGGLGFPFPRGHVDFWPNEGRKQPGCEGDDLTGSCSHGRAPDYYEESISSARPFNGCLCEDWQEFVEGRCKCDVTAPMGEITHKDNAHGNYYLYTAPARPFALG